MSTYAIGDIQGCLSPLKKLLRAINFNPHNDKLWLTGDLVNRGPDSLNTLRYIKSLGKCVEIVLGNHDLHLLKLSGEVRPRTNDTTLGDTLEAHDLHEIVDWLRQKPLFHSEGEYAMVHAGLLPSWGIDVAEELSLEVAEALISAKWHSFLIRSYGNTPNLWNDNLTGFSRSRVILNAMTRLRTCSSEGRMNLSYKGGIETVPNGNMPWFEVPQRQSQNTTIIFGHWSAIGLMVRKNIICVDSGCVWGNNLSAIRLEDRKVFQVSGLKS